MIEELRKLKHAEPSRKTNYLLIPVNVINIDRDGARLFNRIYFYLKKLKLNTLERTPSGGIRAGSRRNGPSWDVIQNRNSVEITALLPEGSWRIQFRTVLPKGLSGKRAFQRFKTILKIRGIDLEKYAVENGEEIKKTIEKPLIGAIHDGFYDLVLENVNHIDFHSSYAAGLANTHKEFADVLNELFQKREEKEEYKNILNFSIGFMQSSKGCKARYASLSRDAIADNNKRVKSLAERLEKKGRMVISFNTDGIWYKGPVYHGPGEGNGLGEWHNDHVNCTFRARSAGSYEYIENGIYFPVVRGASDESKKNWSWGDIYGEDAEPEKFIFSEERGVVLNGETLV